MSNKFVGDMLMKVDRYNSRLYIALGYEVKDYGEDKVVVHKKDVMLTKLSDGSFICDEDLNDNTEGKNIRKYRCRTCFDMIPFIDEASLVQCDNVVMRLAK